MNAKIPGLFAAALLGASMAANAQVVYDFTGVVTNTEGLVQPPIGSQVSGTYTFDFANGNPAQSIGVVGSSNWDVSTYGGPLSGTLPVPTSLVFASTFRDALNNSFTTPPPTSAFGYYGSGANGGPRTFFSAGDNFMISQYVTGYEGFEIVNPHGAYSADGLPVLAGATHAQGTITERSSSNQIGYDVLFTITSLTRAPELDSASAAGGLTLLLSLLAMAMGARPRRP
jgi:hypothetical protein